MGILLCGGLSHKVECKARRLLDHVLGAYRFETLDLARWVDGLVGGWEPWEPGWLSEITHGEVPHWVIEENQCGCPVCLRIKGGRENGGT